MTASTTDESCTLVIFGASGDLTRRKLLPALWSMFQSRVLPEPFAVVGVSRSEMTNEQFRARMREAITDFARVQPPSTRVWERFAQALFYYAGDPADGGMYAGLSAYLKQVEQERGTGANRLFYVSTPPSVYSHAGDASRRGRPQPARREHQRLGAHHHREAVRARPRLGAARSTRWCASVFSEDQIYRIDHYLGKETVQNILVFRFANGIFEPLWNRNYVDHVQITVAEAIGVEGRGGYYEESGALRDMIQNHMLQLLCLVAMEPPVAFDADAVRDEKIKVLRAIRPIAADEVDRVAVRGQYGPGFVGGQRVSGYREEKGVSAESITETFAALQLEIENWRWAGVPFYLRTGKRLPKRASEIAIQFKQTPHLVFRRNPEILRRAQRARAPHPARRGHVALVRREAAGPGAAHQAGRDGVRYGQAFGGEPPEAYERLLLDAMNGDATLYARGDWVMMAWELLQPVLSGWGAGDPRKFPNYEAGTWGPAEADTLIERSGRRWRRP